MRIWEVLPTLFADPTAKATRADWKPPQIDERYVFVEQTPKGTVISVMYSDRNILPYRASPEDLGADDWSLLP